jgi:putative DNA primase/helicase
MAKLAEGKIDSAKRSAPSSAIGRFAKRFALVQVVLGLAHKYDLLPFPVEDIEWAISTCFKDWLTGRGGDGSTALVASFAFEVKQAIAKCRPRVNEWIEHLLVTNEFNDRVFDLRDGDTKKVRNLLA